MRKFTVRVVQIFFASSLLAGCYVDQNGNIRPGATCLEQLEKHNLKPMVGGMMNPDMPAAHYKEYIKYSACVLRLDYGSNQKILYQLAYASKVGKGVKKDHKRYIMYLEKASKPGANRQVKSRTTYIVEGVNPYGHPPAQYELAQYLLTNPSPKNIKRAKAFLTLAAHQGHVEAVALLSEVKKKYPKDKSDK